MNKFVVVALMVLAAAAATHAANPTPPSYPDEYYVSFNWAMPVMEAVNEKVEIYYDGKGGNEFVSYDDGLDANLFVTSAGGKKAAYQISPQATSPSDVKYTCITGGINDSPFMFSGFPYNLQDFEYVGSEEVGGVAANKFFFGKPPKEFPEATNNMTFWADASTGAPLKFDYVGFYAAGGTGFGNSPNYDTFVITYNKYTPGPVNASVFDVPDMCKAAAVSPVITTARQAASRFFPHSVDHDELFGEFKIAHARSYADDSSEHAERKVAFMRNLATVHRLNNKHTTSRYRVNHLGDQHEHEIAARRMPVRKATAELPKDADVYVPKTKSMDELPSAFDWRDHGAIGPLKEQGDCGSCFSFGSAEAFASAVQIKYGELVSFSEQWLLDCSWAYGNQACNGGTAKGSYSFAAANGGWPTEASYPYLMNDGKCHAATPSNYSVAGHKDIMPFDMHAVLDAVVNVGPPAIAVNAAQPEFTWFHSGVADIPHCDPMSLDHEVQLVGFTDDAVIIRNSWSASYGRDGFIYLTRKTNNCGWSSAAVLPVVA